jgi:hypothetical protein
MLGDPKAQNLIDVFAAQWFELQRLAQHRLDVELFPTAVPELKPAMEQETKLFVQDLLSSGSSVQTLLGADYTFVNATLADHYGINAPAADGFSRVSLEGTDRVGGVLGQASFLTHTSATDETSPVKRGAWVLTNILCSPPAPPPPNVSANLPEVDPEAGIQTTRDRLEAHRASPTCAACHSSIDPIGLGLENYGPVGQYRETQEGVVIDPSGQMPDGMTFSDAQGLITLLANDPRLGACVAKKFFTFGLGRAPIPEETQQLAALVPDNLAPMREVLSRLILSESFRSRRGESQTEVTQ